MRKIIPTAWEIMTQVNPLNKVNLLNIKPYLEKLKNFKHAKPEKI